MSEENKITESPKTRKEIAEESENKINSELREFHLRMIRSLTLAPSRIAEADYDLLDFQYKLETAEVNLRTAENSILLSDLVAEPAIRVCSGTNERVRQAQLEAVTAAERAEVRKNKWEVEKQRIRVETERNRLSSASSQALIFSSQRLSGIGKKGRSNKNG